MKKRILAVLCTATALGGVLAVPTAAQAADPYPKGVAVEVGFASATLSFNTMEPPADLKVHLRAKGTTTRVATITSFISRDNCSDGCEMPDSPVQSRSFATGPLKLADLGEYAVDVEYDGTGGEEVLHEDEATLSYQLRPVIEGLKVSNWVSLAERNTVVSGDVKIHDPRDLSYKPFAGATLTRRIGTVATPVTADAEGHFESKVTLTGNEPVFEDSWRYGAYHVPVGFEAELNGFKAQKSTDEVSVSTLRARITLDSKTQTGAYGTRGKISGAVTWRSPDGTYKPAPAGLKISTGPTSATTDGSGRFTASPQFRDDAPWTVVENSPWLYGSGPQVTVNTTAGSQFTGFKASVDKNKTVSVNALFDRAEIPAGTTSLKVEVQHSADGRTGWTTRKSLDVTTRPGANTTAHIETTLPYPGAGHIRLRHAGTAAIHGSVTPAVKVARTMTAIPEFNASPEPVRFNRNLTITGKLTHSDPTWKPFAGQTVAFYFRPAGSTTWRKQDLTAKTGADGTFTRTFTAVLTGSWTARYEETDATHFYAASRVDEVVVNP